MINEGLDGSPESVVCARAACLRAGLVAGDVCPSGGRPRIGEQFALDGGQWEAEDATGEAAAWGDVDALVRRKRERFGGI